MLSTTAPASAERPNGYFIEKAKQMPADVQSDLQSAIRAEIPRMRAYARLMTNDRSKADRAVEKTLKSLSATDIQWCERTQLRIPLFEILRGFLSGDQRPLLNQAYPSTSISVSSSLVSASRATESEQQTVEETGSALMKLNFEEREALILSATAGFSDLDIAEICESKPEIVRARILRGRTRLAELLKIEFDDDLEPATNRVVPLVPAEMQDRASA